MPGICPMCDRPTNGPCACEEILRVPSETWDTGTVLPVVAYSRKMDEAKEALSLVYVMLAGPDEPWASMPYDERCARAANEAQCAFRRLEDAA